MSKFKIYNNINEIEDNNSRIKLMAIIKNGFIYINDCRFYDKYKKINNSIEGTMTSILLFESVINTKNFEDYHMDLCCGFDGLTEYDDYSNWEDITNTNPVSVTNQSGLKFVKTFNLFSQYFEVVYVLDSNNNLIFGSIPNNLNTTEIRSYSDCLDIYEVAGML